MSDQRRIDYLRKVLHNWGLYLHVPGELRNNYTITDLGYGYAENFESLDEVVTWMDGRTWTVTAINRHSGCRSRVQSFRSAKHATYFVDEHRPEADWKDVRMTSKSGGE